MREIAHLYDTQRFSEWQNFLRGEGPFAGVIDNLANKILASLEGARGLMLVYGEQKILPGIEVLFVPDEKKLMISGPITVKVIHLAIPLTSFE